MTFDASSLKYDSQGLVPAIIQDADSGTVLMMAYMNREAVEKTLLSGETWFWSRSRQQLWHKGETSGNVQRVQEVAYDCDRDTLLIKVKQKGAACHEGYFTCFHYRVTETGEVAVVGERQFDPEAVYGPAARARANPPAAEGGDAPRTPGENGPLEKGGAGQAALQGPSPASSRVLEELYRVIRDRQEKRPAGSYTAKLFNKGLDKMLEKLGEETTELIIEAKNRDREEVIEEAADLLYHLLVVLAEQGITPADVFAELAERREPPRL
ncbi:phosphoribosyl-AMP cyclohydrolase [Desulfofundulus thermobenzoicus]|uniref:Histidine biosynthesis bifunctional protein HisIE n=1 Tax=Desulfofundulus thermobenzoicus TaxID=29376 RepID=A0A6N7IUZ0_9FIRM|nr:phosphoribosyl-AMP cyclohydrolase [Desulfofundulus thermobenzoicus]MQL53900.1 phosphoribosyl-AMP cyclohydrolase [Desulfofundulus thermobenzoicus]